MLCNITLNAMFILNITEDKPFFISAFVQFLIYLLFEINKMKVNLPDFLIFMLGNLT
jgi:hypothetical protein